jgi:hypothetical protein
VDTRTCGSAFGLTLRGSRPAPGSLGCGSVEPAPRHGHWRSFLGVLHRGQGVGVCPKPQSRRRYCFAGKSTPQNQAQMGGSTPSTPGTERCTAWCSLPGLPARTHFGKDTMHPRPKTLKALSAAAENVTPAESKRAVKKCVAAYAAAYRDAFQTLREQRAPDEDGKPGHYRHANPASFAHLLASSAYRDQVPPIIDRRSIAAYVACVAHGVVLQVFDGKESTQLMYTAQVAMSVHAAQGEPKPAPKSRKEPRP